MVENSVEIPPGFVQSVLEKEGLSSVEPSENEQIKNDDQQYEVIRSTVAKTLEMMFETFDSESKKRGLPGLGTVPSKQLSELSLIVGEQEFPREMIENSPKVALFTILGGVGANNFIAYQRLKKETAKQPENKEGVHNEN